MRRWKIPALQALALLALILIAGPYIRSPFSTGQPPAAPPVTPDTPQPPPATVSGPLELGPLTMHVTPSQTAVLPRLANDLYLTVRVTSKDLGAVARPPLNVALVLDKSGSMGAERKMEYAKEAAHVLVDLLQDRDYLSIVAYDSEVEVLQPAALVTDKAALHAIVDSLRPSGSTNLSGGYLRGCEEVARHSEPGRVNRVLLMTDGLANNGITEPVALERLVRNQHKEGIGLSTFGLGAEFNEDLLQGLAETGAGGYHFIEDPKAMASIYSGEMENLARTAARGAVLRIEPAEGVKIEEVLGYKVVREEGALLVKLGDLYGGQTRKVVARARVTSGEAGTMPLGKVELACREVDSDRALRGDVRVALDVTTSERTVTASRNREVLELVETTEAAEGLEQAMRLLESGRQDEARERLTKQIEVSAQRNTAEFQSEDLGRQIDAYRELADRLEQKLDAPAQSLVVKSGKFRSYTDAR